MGTTDNPNDPRLSYGADTEPKPQEPIYLVLSKKERAKGFVRPFRDVYKHLSCGAHTHMGREIAETYARTPSFYGATYCVSCRMHRPLSEFVWIDQNTGQVTDETVGS